MRSPDQVVVYKVGGSLLGHADLPDRLARVMAIRDDSLPLLIVGGGNTTDIVRDWDRIHDLGEERSHLLALKSIELNEELLATILPTATRVTTRSQAMECWNRTRIPILSVSEYIRKEERETECQLPHIWAVTSDSIAAWVVETWPASELVLLKSVALPKQCQIEKAQELGLVDAHFDRLFERIPHLGWCQLTASALEIQPWGPHRLGSDGRNLI
jgi:aspartokinase-like uncharacterized kinase